VIPTEKHVYFHSSTKGRPMKSVQQLIPTITSHGVPLTFNLELKFLKMGNIGVIVTKIAQEQVCNLYEQLP